MIGRGSEAVLEKVRPVLSAMGGKLFVLGGLGNGHAMKAINNIIAGATTIAVTEGLTLGEDFGLDPATMVDVLNDSTGRSFVIEQCFGEAWNVATLCRSPQLRYQVQGAIANGVTKEEIRETLMQVWLYAGIPAAAEGFNVAGAVLKEAGLD